MPVETHYGIRTPFTVRQLFVCLSYGSCLLKTTVFSMLSTQFPFQCHCYFLSGDSLSSGAKPGASLTDLRQKNWRGRSIHSYLAQPDTGSQSVAVISSSPASSSAQPSSTLLVSTHCQTWFCRLSGESMSSLPSSNTFPVPHIGQSILLLEKTDTSPVQCFPNCKSGHFTQS